MSNHAPREPQQYSMGAVKRPAAQAPNEPQACKRRAPYAPRACDACRRRKGRCDGRKPCEYCSVRSLECCFSLGPDERRAGANLMGANLVGANLVGANLVGAGSGNSLLMAAAPKDPKWTPESITSLSGLVATMQGQLDTIVAHLNMSMSTQGGQIPDNPSTAVAKSPIKPPRANSSSKRSSAPQFHGPTSPDYSLIVALIRIEEGSDSGAKPDRSRIPSFDDSQSDDDEDAGLSLSPGDDDSVASQESVTPLSRPTLFQFLNCLSQTEAVRLLRVYHEVIGELHPVCDIESLVEQVNGLYNASSQRQGAGDDAELAADEDDLLILNLTLTIALTAEASSESQSRLAATLHNYCRHVNDAKLASLAASKKRAVIALLMGFYHYFNCRIRLAWRMCGLAGRVAMELGLHSRDVFQPGPESDRQHQEVAVLSCSILVLDRQWSAAAGLPSNFQESDFDMARVSLATTPYLKAMMAFTLMSHKFNEPISRVAQGGTCQDEDALEVTNFQIEQWRKRALEKHNFTHPQNCDSYSATGSKSPPWTTLLYLRANAVRGILLRPFFLSISNSLANKKIQRGLEIVSDSINILSALDKSTDVYKKQHPHFQHFLASSCALLFLILSYTEQNRGHLSLDLAADYAHSVRRNFKMALSLSAEYKKSSRASRKLWKRLLSMREPLLRWGILSHGESSEDPASTSTTLEPEPIFSIASGKELELSAKGFDQHGTAAVPFSGDDTSFLDFSISNAAAGLPGLSLADLNNDTTTQYPDPLMFEWPMNAAGTFFSDRGL
ncbi:hypothetical protein EDB81DRAFT_948146 [Dactylonectria macrodidyma]|uniref:Zn(2)-C6 fungal-type domain-containing protein n=1 Tax=Dactylonectria macrodidyma TaxID=307937 RepID=A0A9P9EPS1_9HYPO|nr:hypothetical protein EDB81DRAFT_948146 [Dactylonectria macrodidyma]